MPTEIYQDIRKESAWTSLQNLLKFDWDKILSLIAWMPIIPVIIRMIAAKQVLLRASSSVELQRTTLGQKNFPIAQELTSTPANLTRGL